MGKWQLRVHASRFSRALIDLTTAGGGDVAFQPDSPNLFLAQNRKKNPGPLVTSPRVVWQNSRAAEVYESGPEFDFVAQALWSQEGRQYPLNAPRR